MKQLFNNNNKKKAFTLIELLVVIAIIGVLSGAVIVAMSGTQESAIDSRIKASMAQLRSSIEIYGLVNGANYRGLESNSEISLLIDDIESQVGTPTIKISGSGDKYCLSTNLKSSNELWCIDSAGFAGLGVCINYSCNRSLEGIPISTGLVGYWTMDEGSLLSPNTIRDYSPYGNTGTIYGATFATDRHGQPNKAMSFDGVDDYINCGNGVSLDITDAITVEMWIKPNWTGPINTDGYPAHKELAWRIWDLYGTRLYSPGVYVDGAWRGVSSSRLPQSQWSHIVFTYNSESRTIVFYIDGILKRSSVLSGLSKYTINSSTSPIKVGVFNGGKQSDIDDVRIYNRALSAEEITFLYNSSR